MKTWQGRIDTASSPLFDSFSSSVEMDRRLAPHDIEGSRAHARALARAGILSVEEAEAMDRGLEEIAAEVSAGEFAWRDDLEDVHTHVEVRLREKLGDVAARLHTGRSRNDQIATDLRLYVRAQTLNALEAILALQRSLLAQAERYRHEIMPGYTHLQQAQPVTIGHTLLAYIAMLDRDWERFRNGLDRTNRSPLGAGALAGATFPLDRDFTAQALGFDAVMGNSLDAVSDRDFAVEFVQSAALCMTHLSRFAEDLILWSTVEFGFVRLPDAFASGSSMMPQKKNPDVAELIRGKTALVIGDATGLLALVKGLPLSYDRDLEEVKSPLFHATDTLLASLRILAAMIPELEFDTERTRAALSSFTLATDLADHLVRQGMPFRQAHGVVGRLVSSCLAQGRSLGDLTPHELIAASPALADLPEMQPEMSIWAKRTAGSTHPQEIDAQIDTVTHELTARTAWLRGRR